IGIDAPHTSPMCGSRICSLLPLLNFVDSSSSSLLITPFNSFPLPPPAAAHVRGDVAGPVAQLAPQQRTMTSHSYSPRSHPVMSCSLSYHPTTFHHTSPSNPRHVGHRLVLMRISAILSCPMSRPSVTVSLSIDIYIDILYIYIIYLYRSLYLYLYLC